MTDTSRIPLGAVVFRTDLYPRMATDPTLVQKYASDLEVLPPIEVNQHNELIDGWHRWTAHKKQQAPDIPVFITQTASDVELLALACKRNASHGAQLTEKDKRGMAVRLFHSGAGLDEAAIADTLSVSTRMVSTYLSDVKADLRKQQREAMFSMWLACHTDAEVADACGVSEREVGRETVVSDILEMLPKSQKLLAAHSEDTWEPPLYDIWNPAKNSNAVKHFGNTAVEFVDNLLYTFTQPFDIVVDPFAGGGSTIDICKHRLRRYWASDRAPIVER